MQNTDESNTKDLVDETNDESFPASDPPAWTGMHAGAPQEEHAGSEPPHHATLRHVRSKRGADETVARVENALSAAGMKIFARIDHAAEARAVGLEMRPTFLIVFGNPKGGTALMVARPTAAIDLPLKALIWEDASGATWLTYNLPSLLERHGLEPRLVSRLAPAGEVLERAVAD